MSKKKPGNQPIAFKLHGKPFDPVAGPSIFSRIASIESYLEKSEPGDVFDSGEVSTRIGITARSLADYNQRLREAGLAVKIGQKNFYGRRDTIAALKSKLEN